MSAPKAQDAAHQAATAPKIERVYEDSAERLLAALVAAFGAGPRWELLPNRSYGYYLHYEEDGVSMSDVRAVIDATLGFSIGVILAPRGPRPGELPPIDHTPG